MVAVAAIVEVLFNAFDAAAERRVGSFLRWIFATVLLFALAFAVERYKLLQEG